jgi:predicted HTH transcriptional regulator
MPMPPNDTVPVNSITEQHLFELVSAHVPEGKTIEYKRELKIGNDTDKREFCVDLTSFANAAGGLMLYGIRAENGEAAELIGISITNVDEQITTIEQIINWGISPRLPWFDTHAVKLTGGGYVLAIKIPRSAISPHAHAKDGVCRFFTRGTKGKLPMDIPQVRASFQLSDTLRDRLRNFRAERTARIIAGAGAAPVCTWKSSNYSITKTDKNNEYQ